MWFHCPDFLTSELKNFQHAELSTKDDKGTANNVYIADRWIGLCLMAIDNNTKVMNYDVDGNLGKQAIRLESVRVVWVWGGRTTSQIFEKHIKNVIRGRRTPLNRILTILS